MGFQCRQFYLKDDRCAMKVSTDSLLFGSWVSIERVQRAADLGCGCGILAIMVAQRTGGLVHIDAVEYDLGAVEQAQANVAASPWPEKVSVQHADVLSWQGLPGYYDLVMMNPPYFEAHLNSHDVRRQLARQGGSKGVWQPWLACAARVLKPSGRVALVAPYRALQAITDTAEQLGLVIVRQCDVQSVPNKAPYLVLLELANNTQKCLKQGYEQLVIKAENKYTDAFLHYTGAFYLDKASN